MNRPLLLIAILLGIAQASLFAQDSTSGGDTAVPSGPGTLAAANDPSAPVLLTPPPDTESATTAPAKTTTTTTTTTTTKPASVKTSSGPSIQEVEVIRRKNMLFMADQALASGLNFELSHNYPESRKNYLFAAEAEGSISRSTNEYAKAAEGLTRVDFKLFDVALQAADTNQAKQLIDEVIKYNPNNQAANEKLARVTRALANPNDTSLFGNKAVTPGFIRNVNEVQDLLAQAEQFRRTGQWDHATERLKRILGIDPYNVAATRQLERINAEKENYNEQGRLETRAERLRQVEEEWYEPIHNKDLSIISPEQQEPLTRTTTFDIDQKLKGINISLNFSNATIEEATKVLSENSKKVDPEGKGVNFIIQPVASTTAKPVSLTLNNVPLGEALRYVCQLANVKYKVQDYAISIVPFNANTEDLIQKYFNVQPSFVEPPSTGGVVGSLAAQFTSARPLPTATPAATPDAGAEAVDSNPVRAALEAKGVKFPPGANAVYTASTGVLTVLNTAEQMELIEELVTAGQAPVLMVKISAKFVEINQDDLNDLTVNTAFNFWNPNPIPPTVGPVPVTGPPTNNPLSLSHFGTALPGSQAFVPNNINQLINPSQTAFSSFYFRSFLEGAQYNAVVAALSQKKSYDLLSDPYSTQKSGEQGVLEAVRIFPYPTAFDPPELNNINNNRNNLIDVVLFQPPVVTPSTPTDFKKRNVGVRLVVKPQVAADNHTVDLSLFPEVTDFQGFINYGSPIFIGNPDGSTSLLSVNAINQPVFNTRRVNTRVLISDGSTVVLGGLIREDLQNVNDKVPLLGDLPLIGRLFQSKAMKNTQRNLIIFVTANIYRNDGELLNPPEEVNAADVLTGHVSVSP